MDEIKVLIVDDSPLTQEVLTSLLSSQEGITIVGKANNGLEALTMVETSRPDIITMDISMPKMDGMEAITRIMAHRPTPILVISDITDSKVRIIALAHGALEVIPKSWLQPEQADNLIEKIRLISKIKVIRHIQSKISTTENLNLHNPSTIQNPEPEHIICIASSTGGPKVLEKLLSSLPAYFPYPILVAQHIDATFVDGLVDFLNDASPLKIKQGADGEIPVAGAVYFASPNRHITVDRLGHIKLLKPEPNDIYIPSCDRLLCTVADAYKEKCIGIILTGMGNDGVMGMQRIKTSGGATFAQDEESSVIFGMPNLAIETGCADAVLPPKQIGIHLRNLMKKQVES